MTWFVNFIINCCSATIIAIIIIIIIIRLNIGDANQKNNADKAQAINIRVSNSKYKNSIRGYVHNFVKLIQFRVQNCTE